MMNRMRMGLIVGLCALALGGAAAAEKKAPAGKAAQPKKDDVSLLFVQNATAGTLTPVKGEKSVFTLTLEGVSRSTMFFSDRPKKVAGHEPTKVLIDNWGTGANSFKATPPNAALDILDGRAEGDVLVVKISEPTYDEKASRLTYRAEVLKDGATGAVEVFNEKSDHADSIPAKFDHAALFVDASAPDLPKLLSTGSCPGCNLMGMVIIKGSFPKANLSQANVSEAYLCEADLRGADLSGSNLIGTNFSLGNLTGANLHGANLVRSQFDRADLTDADFTSAVLGREVFDKAKLCRTKMPDGSIENGGCP